MKKNLVRGDIMQEKECEKIEKFAKILENSKRIVAFTGAGVSTESNIPDFRSSKGVYESIEREYGKPAEVLLSHSFFKAHPETFFDYMRKFLIFPDAKPNPAHLALAALEKQGKLSCVVTQNIDGLHQKAGSKNVCELHGSLYDNYCVGCGEKYPVETVVNSVGLPYCKKCGGIIRPGIVLYEEQLNSRVVDEAVGEIGDAGTLLIMGTSLVVYPAAGFVRYFRGNHMVLINKSQTSCDSDADLLISAPAGETMRAALEIMGSKI